MSTVFRTVVLSNSKWFCFRTARRRPGEISILPFVGSISPESIFRKVDFPAPLAPITPQQFPLVKETFTSSNRTRFPNRRVTLFARIIHQYFEVAKVPLLTQVWKTGSMEDWKWGAGFLHSIANH